MNKYQDALDFIIAATNGGNGMVKELNTLQELVDKATPKKPRGIKKDRCPNCGSYNEIFPKRRNTVAHDIVYCWHCGNAIELE
ncbi:uncharacterized protein BN631_01479 [Amedibacillus dolichus CAG:375]|uniref:Uncharacterized protein n=1 Tax=Amedibacillus dolichus CAG:375 TaxID=1263076 RepID=R7G6G0_9FIRM|nr:hypothetical protein [Amedibacillus dolichus]CDE23009.1 uncharacterized protein BN631_01479 [Amedibacillus dolichus CAG:375]